MIYEMAKQYKGDFSIFKPYAPADDRESWKALPEKLKQDLLAWGEKHLGYEYPWLPADRYMEFCRIGNRANFEGLYFPRRRALNALVMAECVEGKGRFLNDIVNGIMSICEESGWQLPAHNHDGKGEFECLPDKGNPVMDLFACETGAQLAMAAYLLKSQLDCVTPLIIKRIYAELTGRILNPYLNKHFGWMGEYGEEVNNWTPWCTQNTLTTIFSMEGIKGEIKQKVLEQAAKSLDIFLNVYGEDGCCNEGASYYRAAGLCLFNAIEVMDAVTGNEFVSLYQNNKIRNIAPYIMNVHVNDKYYANFSDCAPVCERPGVREFLFAKQVGNENMMGFAASEHKRDENYLLPNSENLFYRLQAAFTEKEISSFDTSKPVKKTDIYYESVGILLARDSNYFLAVKAGCNGDSHNHNDTGSITVYKNGKPFLIDVGVETYSRKTFSPDRYEIWTMQSAYHNVVTFGEEMQKDGSRYGAKVSEIILKEEKAGITMELAGCYTEGTVKSYLRKVEFIKEQEIRITDTFKPLPKNTYLSLMTLEQPELQGKTLLIGGLGKIYFEPGLSAKIEEIKLTDPKLMKEWGEKLYRTKIYINDLQLTFSIKD